MIELKNVSFTYENGELGVHDVNLRIEEGELVLLCGTSGCGKTTVTRLINGLVPNYYEGQLSGEVTVNGIDVSAAKLYELAGTVGSVFQNPRSQFFNVDTTGELAFGCENIGMPVEEIRARINKVKEDLALEHLMDRNIFMLSGGEKQKIACGSVAALNPKVMVLDEPSSNLDIMAIKDLKQMIEKWKAEGKTIVIAEHRLFYLANICDKVVIMEHGRIVREMSGDEFRYAPYNEFMNARLRTRGLEGLKYRGVCRELSKDKVVLENFTYAYKGGKAVVDVPWAEFPKGAVVALIGHNGAGKTTFSQMLCGLVKQKQSAMTVDGKRYRMKERRKICYMVMQDVNHQLFTESVLEEVMLSQREENEKLAVEILRELDLEQYQESHPISLSGGQRQRVAIGSALAADCEIIVYDEPTSGLDYLHMQTVARSMELLRAKGKTQMVVTHDPELILACCDYVIHMEKGKIKESYALNQQGTEKMLMYFCA